MKKYFIYIAACLVALCMANCSNGNSKKAPQEGEKMETVKKEKTKQTTPKEKEKQEEYPQAQRQWIAL